MRKITERPEGIEAGTVKLVGFENEKIYSETMRLLEDKTYIRVWPRQKNPYADGKATERIVDILEEVLY